MLSWMYCEKLKSMPMNCELSFSFISSTSWILVRPFGHSLCGFSGTKNSARNDPSGSVASSPRPCSEATVCTGANCRMVLRIAATVSCPASSVMVGGITARIQRLPSSSLGRNSVPSRAPSTPTMNRKANAIIARDSRIANRQRQQGQIDPADLRTRKVSISCILSGSRTEASTGVTVKVAITAPISA